MSYEEEQEMLKVRLREVRTKYDEARDHAEALMNEYFVALASPDVPLEVVQEKQRAANEATEAAKEWLMSINWLQHWSDPWCPKEAE